MSTHLDFSYYYYYYYYPLHDDHHHHHHDYFLEWVRARAQKKNTLLTTQLLTARMYSNTGWYMAWLEQFPLHTC